MRPIRSPKNEPHCLLQQSLSAMNPHITLQGLHTQIITNPNQLQLHVLFSLHSHSTFLSRPLHNKVDFCRQRNYAAVLSKWGETSFFLVTMANFWLSAPMSDLRNDRDNICSSLCSIWWLMSEILTLLCDSLDWESVNEGERTRKFCVQSFILKLLTKTGL